MRRRGADAGEGIGARLRRHGVALLNTARLMKDDPLLLRLKELEALEKLVEKVGRIDLHTGSGAGGLDALLQNLYRLRGEANGA
jgi:hypothetical protein